NPSVEPTPSPVVEKPKEAASIPPDSAPVPVVTPPALPVAPVEPPTVAPPAPAPEKTPDPVAFPRVQGLGFDPKALEADRKPEAPADPALAPAAQERRPEEPARGMERPAVPDERERPREVDPELLPPDP